MDTNNWRPAQAEPAMDLSDYLRKISLEMPAMETESQTAMPSNLPSNFASNSENPPDPASLDSTAQTGTTNVGDWQEEVYQKLQIMKEMYLPDLNEMHQKIAAKLQQHDSLPRQLKTEQLEKLKIFKAMLERMIAVLQFSKNSMDNCLFLHCSMDNCLCLICTQCSSHSSHNLNLLKVSHMKIK